MGSVKLRVMELEGVINTILEQKTGTTQRGSTWTSQDFVVETEGRYPKKVCLSVGTRSIDTLSQFKAGDRVKVEFDIDAREYNGRWFNTFNCWRIEGI